MPSHLAAHIAASCLSRSSSVTRAASPSNDDIQPSVPVIAAGCQHHARVGPQIDGLLLGCAGVEIERSPVPHRGSRVVTGVVIRNLFLMSQAAISSRPRAPGRLMRPAGLTQLPAAAGQRQRSGRIRKSAQVIIGDVDQLTGALAGVRRSVREGLAQWRYHGRLVARQLDDAHIVIRADFDYRALLLRQYPGTFSVPRRYAKHMMVVADFSAGDAGAIEDALEAAWELQRDSG